MKKTVSLLMAGLMVCGTVALAGCQQKENVSFKNVQNDVMHSVVEFLDNHNAEKFDAIAFKIEMEGKMTNTDIVDLTEGEEETEDEVTEYSNYKGSSITYVAQDLIKIESKTEETGVEYDYDDEKKCDYKVEFKETEVETFYLQKGTKKVSEEDVEGYWAWQVSTTTRTENGGEPITDTEKCVYFYDITSYSKFADVVDDIIDDQFRNAFAIFAESDPEDAELFTVSKNGDVYNAKGGMYNWNTTHSKGSLTYNTQDVEAIMNVNVKDISKTTVKFDYKVSFDDYTVNAKMNFGFTSFGEKTQKAVKTEIQKFNAEEFTEYDFYFDVPYFGFGS